MNLDDFKALKKGISSYEEEKFYFHNDLGVFSASLKNNKAIRIEDKGLPSTDLPLDLQNVIFLTDFDPDLVVPRVLMSTEKLHKEMKIVQALRMESKQRGKKSSSLKSSKAKSLDPNILAERLVKAALDGSL